MRKIFTFKTLLVAAGLLMGSSSAWADTYQILYGTPVQVGDVITGVTAQTSFTDTYAVTLASDLTDGNNNSSLNLSGSVLATTTVENWTKNFSSDITSGKVYFSGIYRIAANTNQRIRIVDSAGNVIFGTAQNNTGNNADQIVAYICGKEISSYVRLPRSAGYGVNEICIDLDAKTVSYNLTVSSGSGSTTNKTGTVDIPSSYSNNVRGLFFAKASGDGYITYLDNVKFYSVQSSDPEYTINYKLGEETVRSVSGHAAVDEIVTADIAINGEGTYSGNHYLITAATAPSMTIIDGTNTLNVPVRAPYTATLNVTKIVNGVETASQTDLTETDEKVCSWSFAYSKFEKSGDVYYACDETSYVQSGTFTDGETVNKTVKYSNADLSIMSFSELGTGGTNADLSGGTYGQTTENLASCTLNKGSYKALIYVYSRGGTGSHTRNANLIVNGSTVSTTPQDTYGLQTLNFTIDSDGTAVYVQGNGASNTTDNLDYVLIQAVSVPVTITDAGYATFSSAYALDLAKANLPSGLSAYYVNSGDVTSTTATFTEPDKAVAAGEGLLFKGTAGEIYNVSVAATGEALTGNALKATDGSAVAAGKYVFAYENANPTTTAGFYQLDNATVVAAGKAYLDTASSAKVLRFVFGDGTATGIEAAEAAEAEADGPVYNVAGQQVGEDYKGIVIKNGKKYLQK